MGTPGANSSGAKCLLDLLRLPPMGRCIYCRAEGGEPSAEHVIADALGGSIELPADYVCKRCNNAIDQAIDRPVQQELAPVLSQLEIPGKRGTPTAWAPTEIVDGEQRKFIVTKEEIKAAEPRKLLAPAENGVYSFRARSREELERARAEIAHRHPDRTVVLASVEERVPELPETRIDYIDFTQPHWARWAAKTVLNVVGFVSGRDIALRSELDDLRRLALHGDGRPVDLLFGGIGDEVPEVAALPAEHSIRYVATAEKLSVVVTLFDYCGCSLSRGLPALPDVVEDILLDAIEKRRK